MYGLSVLSIVTGCLQRSAGMGIFKYYLCLSTKAIHKLVKYDLHLEGA